LAHFRALTVALTIVSMGLARTAHAQALEPPPPPPVDAPVQIGSLVVAPVFQMANVGYDSNANSKSPDQRPVSDYTATFSPVVQAWLTSPHIHLLAHGQADYYYFKELTNLRALDTDTGARFDVPLNLLTPYFIGGFTSTQFQQNFEIVDAIARRRNSTLTVGTDVRLTDKISAGAYGRHTTLQYDANSLYQATDLAKSLNHTSTAEGVDVKYALTPFTTVGAQAEQARSHFDSATTRDSKDLLITPEVWFSPLALVNGHAAFGFRKRVFLGGGQPDFNGTAAQVDLSYTLLGRTRFTVLAKRDLEYTYVTTLNDYIVLETDLSVSSRVGEFWEVGVSTGRDTVTYLATTPLAPGTPTQPNEGFWSSSAALGYRTGRARIGFHVDYRVRTSELPVPLRTYERFRIGTTLSYPF
jgi:hypothetical protein